ncbi:MAG: hypothetical protein JWP08_3494 [Bryobacterales bacterium]|nr:hypothetical protein [Bryobacterales bacterium]
MSDSLKPSRRLFLGQATSIGAATLAGGSAEKAEVAQNKAEISKYPRVFRGRQLQQIAFPLGGVGAGSVSLGGRGQLRDWEIFNRPDKGHNLSYAFPSIWVQSGKGEPVARVLEARYHPPYDGQDGLGSQNAPGLARLAGASFTGEFPLAHVEFQDSSLPVSVILEAFSPFIPHEPDESGLPVAILRYRVRNQGTRAAKVSIAWSIENPVGTAPKGTSPDSRRKEYRAVAGLAGLMMTNPGLPDTDALQGSFALAAIPDAGGRLTHLTGWPKGRWWNSPLLFWDDFSADGELGPDARQTSAVGALCLTREIPSGASAAYTFVLGWHFANRTPARCGWTAPKGLENTVIGNWYATRFPDAWAAAEYAAANLERLESKTRLFAQCLRESTLPGAAIDAAAANLSTLVSTTTFRTADGEFHGFEGVDDHTGCCFGNCTHVWNYETATAHLFPSFARSLRKASFGYSMDDAGAMHFRQLLPDGKERSGFAAADGQMGQVVHAYLDWKLSGDRGWLEELWPRIRKAIEFAWVPGGWDANRDGVMEGVQHNTYDVEFYGPNPQCGMYYLAALRAGEEMAGVVGDTQFGAECRRLFESGSRWMDANLFNGEFFIQDVRPYRNDQIAASLRSQMGAEDPEHPEYQIGKGCLADQLVGQYLADVCGLGPLVDERNIRKTLDSIYRYNYKRNLFEHENVQRTYVLNDEAAVLVADYAKVPRPRIPFPYFAEAWTGMEYSTASAMLFGGMVSQGVECIESVRARYDGERRNPWDEPECGHHYARAMSSWSGILALSGFEYHGGRQELTIAPRWKSADFRCFWSTGQGWGVFTRKQEGKRVRIEAIVHHGELGVRSCRGGRGERPLQVQLDGRSAAGSIRNEAIELREPVTVREGQRLTIEIEIGEA